MRIGLLIIFIFHLSILKSEAQSNYRYIYSTSYTSNYFNNSEAITTHDGGLIFIQIATDTLASTGNGFSVIKTDANGAVQWSSYIYWNTPISTTGEAPEDIVELSDGSFVILGHYHSGSSLHLIHIDGVGSLISVKQIVKMNAPPTGYSMILDADSSLLISGYNAAFASGMFLKTTLQGNVVWAKRFKPALTVGTAINTACSFSSIHKTSDGGILISGDALDTLGTGCSKHIQVVKLDSLGNIIWSKTIIGSGCGGTLLPGTSFQTSNGDFIVLGQYFYTNNNFGYQPILKMNISGDILWYKGFKNIAITGVTEINGNYLLGSSFFDPVWGKRTGISMIDSSGNPISDLTFQGNNYNSLLLDDSSYRYDSNISMKLNQNSNAIFYINHKQQSTGKYFPEILKTDNLFQSDCFTYESSIEDTILAFIVDTSYLEIPLTFTTSDISNNFGSQPMNIYASSSCLPTSNNFIEATELPVLIYPNPNPGTFTISVQEVINKATIEITNLLGEKIFTDELINVKSKEIFSEKFIQGIYLIKIVEEDKCYSSKIIVY